MKKFLSLVLAMIMTMSLATISAGAAEYKDLTDKDEIEYEEAVAVLNRIGIITGYEDGSFRPETELTRGAAAKIIVSLLIGPEAASNLPNTYAPYPDVPAGHTFAGVISYCKTAGIISGYGDGTFKPANSLTGYAFAKMLLGALGYDSKIQGYTDTGWTMNVARDANIAGLFNRISFDGAASVNREEACQLALNTLKATMVEYSGGFTVTTGDATVTGAQSINYKVSNQAYAKNINNKKAASNATNATNDVFTVEFGEEHFKDLRMDNGEGEAKDAFGRPSNEWSYKKVTIGTFPIAADFTFVTQVAHKDATAAAKKRALGMGSLKADASTEVIVNGDTTAATVAAVEDIADLTDNGTVVEVYVKDDTAADYIDTVVVVKSQLAEIKKVGSDYVSIQKYNDNKGADTGLGGGFNETPIDEAKLANVQAEDAAYAVVKDMKAGDAIIVVPLYDEDGTNPRVSEAYKPETVTGTLTKVDTYTKNGRSVTSLTVGGTAYKVALWNRDIKGIDADKIKLTKKDVTLLLDAGGNAMVAKDVGSTSAYVVFSEWSSTLVNGKIVDIAECFDMSGNKVELNIGNGAKSSYTLKPGDLIQYTNDGVIKSAGEWLLDPATHIFTVKTTDSYKIKKSDTQVALDGETDPVEFDDGVKFVYVTFDDNKVDSVNVVKGVQNVDNTELLAHSSPSSTKAQAYTNDGETLVKAVVIKNGSGVLSSNVLYIRETIGSEQVVDGKKVYGYRAAVVNGKDFDDDMIVYSDTKLKAGDFATWIEGKLDGVDGTFYETKKLTETKKSTSAAQATLVDVVNPTYKLKNDNVLRVWDYKKNNTTTALKPDTDSQVNRSDVEINLGLPMTYDGLMDGNAADTLRVSGANWVDETGNGISSGKMLKEYEYELGETAGIRFVFNDKPGDDDFRKAILVVVFDVESASTSYVPADPTVETEVDPPEADEDFETVLDGMGLRLDGEPTIGDDGAHIVVKMKEGDGVEAPENSAIGDKMDVFGVDKNAPDPEDDVEDGDAEGEAPADTKIGDGLVIYAEDATPEGNDYVIGYAADEGGDAGAASLEDAADGDLPEEGDGDEEAVQPVKWEIVLSQATINSAFESDEDVAIRLTRIAFVAGEGGSQTPEEPEGPTLPAGVEETTAPDVDQDGNYVAEYSAPSSTTNFEEGKYVDITFEGAAPAAESEDEGGDGDGEGEEAAATCVVSLKIYADKETGAADTGNGGDYAYLIADEASEEDEEGAAATAAWGFVISESTMDAVKTELNVETVVIKEIAFAAEVNEGAISGDSSNETVTYTVAIADSLQTVWGETGAAEEGTGDDEGKLVITLTAAEKAALSFNNSASANELKYKVGESGSEETVAAADLTVTDGDNDTEATVVFKITTPTPEQDETSVTINITELTLKEAST